MGKPQYVCSDGGDEICVATWQRDIKSEKQKLSLA